MDIADTIPDVQGKIVLDIGGYDGGVAKLALAKGARQVFVVDNGQYLYYGWPAPDLQKLEIESPGLSYVCMNFYEWTRPVDIVLCHRVIYHLPDPWAAAMHMRKLTREVAVVSSSVIPGDESLWRIYRPTEGHPDESTARTIFWRPTESGLRVLLENVGFIDVRRMGTLANDEVVMQCHQS